MDRDLLASLPIVAIITALPKEFASIRAMFDEVLEFIHPDDPNEYVICVATDHE
jgi:hypothetical protein